MISQRLIQIFLSKIYTPILLIFMLLSVLNWIVKSKHYVGVAVVCHQRVDLGVQLYTY
jgi:hypothetical protein